MILPPFKTLTTIRTGAAAPAPALHMAAPALLLQNLARGGAAQGIIDMDRTKIRLDGLASYSVIAALLLNNCRHMFSSTNKRNDEAAPKTLKIFKTAFTALAIISIVSGMYTTVVFSLLGLYSKTALGMGKDSSYFEFFAATERYRKLAFDAFLLSLVSFEVAFIASVFIDLNQGSNRSSQWWATALAAACVAFSLWDWGSIIGIARRLLF
jgi:hypothetical protein